MLNHRLNVHGQTELMGHFDSKEPWSQDEIKNIAAMFHEIDVYRLVYQVTEIEIPLASNVLNDAEP